MLVTSAIQHMNIITFNQKVRIQENTQTGKLVIHRVQQKEKPT